MSDAITLEGPALTLTGGQVQADGVLVVGHNLMQLRPEGAAVSSSSIVLPTNPRSAAMIDVATMSIQEVLARCSRDGLSRAG